MPTLGNVRTTGEVQSHWAGLGVLGMAWRGRNVLVSDHQTRTAVNTAFSHDFWELPLPSPLRNSRDIAGGKLRFFSVLQASDSWIQSASKLPSGVVPVNNHNNDNNCNYSHWAPTTFFTNLFSSLISSKDSNILENQNLSSGGPGTSQMISIHTVTWKNKQTKNTVKKCHYSPTKFPNSGGWILIGEQRA